MSNPPTETTFVDRVARNLREGRFLLLILGDGIREEMAELADYLMHHSLRYAFGMAEVRLYTLPDGSTIAMPRLLARTQTIERHVTIVTTQGSNITITGTTPVVSEKLEKTSLSTDEFYELMVKNDPRNVLWLKELLGHLSDLPIDLQAGSRGESLMLKMPVGGEQIQLMLVTPTSAQFWGVPNKHWNDPAWQKLSRSYLEKIVSLVPGFSIREFNRGMDIKQGDKFIPLNLLHGKAGEVAEIMRQTIQAAIAYYQSAEIDNLSREAM